MHQNPDYPISKNRSLEYNIPLYTHPAKTYEDAIEECAQRAESYAYMSPNFTALAGELRAILRKAQENPLQDKLDAIANKVVFGKAQEK